MILGLDVSTSIVGVTIVDNDNNIELTTSWDLRNKNHYPSLFHKAYEVEKQLKTLATVYIYAIDAIYIEKSLQTFRSGFSSAQTLSTLASFNGIVSWMCYRIFGKVPEYVSASSARKLCGIKVPRGQKAKQVVLQFLLDNEPNFEVVYTKHGNPKPDSYDRADSIVVARAGYKLCQDLKITKN